MDAADKEFFFQLLKTPAVSGSEQAVQRLALDRYGPAADRVETDVYGNLVLCKNPGGRVKVLLAGHCDQIGFMVTRINPDGFLLVEAVGGIDPTVLSGTPVVVHAAGGPIPGVFGVKPTHLKNQQETKEVKNLASLWIDIGARDRAAAEPHVTPGDYVTFKPGVAELLGDRVQSPSLDNRAGLFAVLEAFRQADPDPGVALYAVSTVQEEVGSRGAAAVANKVQPDVGIAVDVTFAFDDPGTSQQVNAPCFLGRGPCVSHGPNTNPAVERLLAEAAGRAEVGYQPAPTGDLEGNDSKVLQVADSGVAAATVGIPNRNMHTPAEVCSLGDIAAAARLLAEFATGLRADADFRPLRVG
jgi:endoglucanase